MKNVKTTVFEKSGKGRCGNSVEYFFFEGFIYLTRNSYNDKLHMLHNDHIPHPVLAVVAFEWHLIESQPFQSKKKSDAKSKESSP